MKDKEKNSAALYVSPVKEEKISVKKETMPVKKAGVMEKARISSGPPAFKKHSSFSLALRALRLRITPFSVVVFISLLIYTAGLLYMYLWGFITSLKTPAGFRHNLFGLPDGNVFEWEWQNYVSAFNAIRVKVGLRYVTLGPMFFNTLGYSFISAFVRIFCTWAVSYVLAKFKYKFSGILYNLIIIVMLTPVIGTLPTSLHLYKDVLNFYDSWLYIFITAIGINGADMMIFYAFFLGIGANYMEAAKIDGANNLQIMLKIMFPITSQMFLVLFVGSFVNCWNDYMSFVIWLPSIPTLAYAIFKFKDSTDPIANWPPMQITACMLLMLPLLIAFFPLKRYFMGNIQIGALK